MSDDGFFLAFGFCWSCRRSFMFDPERVPSIPIDPETNSALDVNRDGTPREFTADERARSVKLPVCSDCLALANAKRREAGRPEILVLPGAYGPET